MRVRQLSILMLAGLTLVAACSSGDDSSKSTSGKSHSISTSNPPVTSPGSTTTAKPRIPFAAGFAQIQQALVDAKGDACKLYNFPRGLDTIQNPATTDESKAAANMLATYFMDIADVMQTDHPSQAAALRSGTTKYVQEAAKANYDLTNPSVNEVTTDKPFQQAYATFQQQNSNCASATTTTTGK